MRPSAWLRLRRRVAFGIFGIRGAVAQSGERLNGIEEVGGSTPPSSTIADGRYHYLRDVAGPVGLTAICHCVDITATACVATTPHASASDAEPPNEAVGLPHWAIPAAERHISATFHRYRK